ncbi:MAG TPA: hypothetical protein VNH11_36250 [Pirellulales bacterium]|nr:hypothetical protein [Pirellulales bacterium]
MRDYVLSFVSKRPKREHKRQAPRLRTVRVKSPAVRRPRAIVDRIFAGSSMAWSNRANWNTHSLPGATDDIVIRVTGDPTVVHASGTGGIRGLSSDNTATLSRTELSVATTAKVDNSYLTRGLHDSQDRGSSFIHPCLTRRSRGGGMFDALPQGSVALGQGPIKGNIGKAARVQLLSGSLNSPAKQDRKTMQTAAHALTNGPAIEDTSLNDPPAWLASPCGLEKRIPAASSSEERLAGRSPKKRKPR